ARAKSSLPVPGSPTTRIGSDERAAFSRSRKAARSAGSHVTMPTRSLASRSRSCAASLSGSGGPLRASRSSRSSPARGSASPAPAGRLCLLGAGPRELGAQAFLGAGRAGDRRARRLEIFLEALDLGLLAHQRLTNRADLVLETADPISGRELVPDERGG